jgi:hypothetical protein
MSWNAEFSVLPVAIDWPVPEGTYEYSPGHMEQDRLPIWMESRATRRDFQTVAEGWELYIEWASSTLGRKSASSQGWALLLLSWHNATAASSKLSVIPPHIYRNIDALAKEKYGWPRETLIDEIQDLRNETRVLLESLNEGQTGLVRVYEWGKF